MNIKKMFKNTVEWNYIKEADLTIGEQKVSKTAKIILVIVLSLLAVVISLGIYFRTQIYDFIVNPGIILPDSLITLEVGSEFIPENYIIKSNEEIEIIYPKPEEVDTNKLGTYNVQYIAKNSMNENKYNLEVHIVDTTAPEILLKQDLIILTKGINTDKFNPADYIKDYFDNYDKKEDLILTYTDSINFEKESVDIMYSVKDTSGNETITKLALVINVPPETTTTTTTTTKPTEPIQPTQPPTVPIDPNPSQPTKPTQPSQPTTPKPTSPKPTTKPTQPKPYINGVHDVTVNVGTDFGTLTNLLISGVYGSGYVSCDFSEVNLTVPGVYRAIFSSSDGVTKIAKVTVVE